MADYEFDLQSGTWTHKTHQATFDSLDLSEAMDSTPCEISAIPARERRETYRSYLEQAKKLAARFARMQRNEHNLAGDIGDLQFFSLARESLKEVETG